MIHTKRVIFTVLPLLFVPVVYGISSTPNACAAPPHPGWTGSGTCAGKTTDPRTGREHQTCCWTERERVPGQYLAKEVRYCQTCSYVPGNSGSFDCKPKQAQLTAPPTTGESILPGEGVAEQPEQPLFGDQNDAGVPPTGGTEQPPTATTQPTPGGGVTEGGSAEQPPTPQAGQDDNQGGGLPPIKNQENVPPGGGVVEQPEDEGQEDSSDGTETAGPLT